MIPNKDELNYKEATTEQLKTLYNAALSEARETTRLVLDLRDEIINREPRFRGPSFRHLETAHRSLYEARTFIGHPFDLPESENPHRQRVA